METFANRAAQPPKCLASIRLDALALTTMSVLQSTATTIRALLLAIIPRVMGHTMMDAIVSPHRIVCQGTAVETSAIRLATRMVGLWASTRMGASVLLIMSALQIAASSIHVWVTALRCLLGTTRMAARARLTLTASLGTVLATLASPVVCLSTWLGSTPLAANVPQTRSVTPTIAWTTCASHHVRLSMEQTQPIPTSASALREETASLASA
mmetsp:Transcript_44188/g.32167  ORF Transcript_44188/g.32167 Transcript_44188/m.32167 type:complete len:212 (-) Transcript_44188:299-934(-)